MWVQIMTKKDPNEKLYRIHTEEYDAHPEYFDIDTQLETMTKKQRAAMGDISHFKDPDYSRGDASGDTFETLDYIRKSRKKKSAKPKQKRKIIKKKKGCGCK